MCNSFGGTWIKNLNVLKYKICIIFLYVLELKEKLLSNCQYNSGLNVVKYRKKRPSSADSSSLPSLA